MKYILALTLLSATTLIKAACEKKVDPLKVVLFIDTNNSEHEIETAEKAACERGETLSVIPKNYKEYIKMVANVDALARAQARCKSNCEEIDKKYAEGFEKFENFKLEQTELNQAIDENLKDMSTKKSKVQSVIISGHDGGGQFGGYKGFLSREQLGELMKRHPNVNEVKSILLLGCYTGVQKEIVQWKEIFPDAKMIAGYDLKAPLSNVPKGHKYLYELLTKEKSLYSQKDATQLTNFAKTNMTTVFSDLSSAVYLSCGPQNQDLYYASSRPGRKFNVMDKKICKEKATEIEDMLDKIHKYLSGELEPPTDTNGALRKIYNLAREVEHCTEQLPDGFDANGLFNLLFYHNIEESFASFYNDDLAQAEKIVASINLSEWEKNVKKDIEKLESMYNKEMELIELLENSPVKLKAITEKELAPIQQGIDELLKAHPFIKDHKPSGESYLTDAQDKAYQEYVNLKQNLDDIKEDVKAYLENPKATAKTFRESLIPYKKKIDAAYEKINAMKRNPEKLKDIWVPTAKNLKAKTRKELLDNLHKMDGLASEGGLSPHQKAALIWASDVTALHLNQFQNPFSWHETYPGRPEAPQQVYRLQDQLDLFDREEEQ